MRRARMTPEKARDHLRAMLLKAEETIAFHIRKQAAIERRIELHGETPSRKAALDGRKKMLARSVEHSDAISYAYDVINGTEKLR